jgi:hypothetical protein
MTRKHFEAIAKILRRNNFDTNPAAGYDEGYANAAMSITVELADYLATQNANFDRQRFLTACGL